MLSELNSPSEYISMSLFSHHMQFYPHCALAHVTTPVNQHTKDNQHLEDTRPLRCIKAQLKRSMFQKSCEQYVQ